MFAYWILILARKFFSFIPVGFARALGRGLGKLGFYLDWKHRKIALDNLTRSFPERTDGSELRRIADRKSVVSGKSVYLGGRRIL